MTSYKLTYFNIRGLAEMSRLLLVDAGVDYEDERLDFAEWKTLKPNYPFGKLPILTVDDKYVVANSRAIFRYLARVLEYEGETPELAALQDAWIENLSEESAKLSVNEDDQELKKKKLAEVMNEHMKPKLSKLDEALGKECGPYLFQDKPMAIDFFVYSLAFSLREWKLIEENEFKNIVTLEQAIADRPNIKAWIVNRPKSDY